MKNPRILVKALISLIFLCFYQQPTIAGCANHEAIGWTTNINTGKRSENISGKSFRCGNAYSSGGGFRSSDLTVSTTICLKEEMCQDNGFEPNMTYISIGNDDSMKPVSVEAEVVAITKNFITVRAKNSPISYTWRDGKYMPCHGCGMR